MIRIATAQGDLDLSASTSIEFNLNSPLFSEADQIKGDYTLDFTLPFTDNNKAMLGHPDVVENAKKFQDNISVRIFLENLPWMSGKLKVKSNSPAGFSVNFASGISQASAGLKEKSLKDVVDKPFQVPMIIDEKFVTLEYLGVGNPDEKISVTVFGEKYEETIAQGDTIEAALQRIANAISLASGLSTTHIAPNFLKFVQLGTFDIEQDMVIDAEPFRITDSFMVSFNAQYTDWLDAWLLGTIADEDVKFTKVGNEAFLQELRSNIINPGFALGNLPYFIKPLFSFTTDFAPYPRLSFVLQKIEVALGIKFEGDFMEDPDIATLLQHHTGSLGLVKKFIGPDPFLFWRTSFNLSEFMPGYKINEYIKRLAAFFNLSFEYDARRRVVKLLKKEDIIKNTAYTDITHLCSAYDNFENNSADGITLQSKRDAATPATLPPEKDPYLPYVIGNGGQLIEIEMAGLAEETSGAVSISHAKDAEITPKLMFYTGIITLANGFKYAKAGIESTNYSLSWHGPKGMYEKWWKAWARFEQRKALAKRKVGFGIADIINLDWTKKYRVDRVNYLLKSIRVVATMDGLKEADVEMYKT